MSTGPNISKRVLALPASLAKAPKRVMLFAVGYVATWFFAGIALQVAVFLAE